MKELQYLLDELYKLPNNTVITSGELKKIIKAAIREAKKNGNNVLSNVKRY